MKKLLLAALTFFSITGFSQTTLPIKEKIPISKQDSIAHPKVFTVLEITVHNIKMYEQYRISVEPIIKAYGGKYLVRSGGMVFDNDPKNKIVPVEGNWNPNRFIIVQFDSMEQLQKFVLSEEYKIVAHLRTGSATTRSIVVNEYQPIKK